MSPDGYLFSTVMYMINPPADGLCFYHALLLYRRATVRDPYLRKMQKIYQKASSDTERQLYALDLRSMVHSYTITRLRQVLAKDSVNRDDKNFLFRITDRLGKGGQPQTMVGWVRFIHEYSRTFIGSSGRSKIMWANNLDIDSAARLFQVRICVKQGPNVIKYGGTNKTAPNVCLLLDCQHFYALNNEYDLTKSNNSRNLSRKSINVVNFTRNSNSKSTINLAGSSNSTKSLNVVNLTRNSSNSKKQMKRSRI